MTVRILWFHKQAMVFANDFVERVTQRIEEVIVSKKYLALQVKLDDGLRSSNSVDLSLEVRGSQLLNSLLIDARRNIRGELENALDITLLATNDSEARLVPSYSTISGSSCKPVIEFVLLEAGNHLGKRKRSRAVVI